MKDGRLAGIEACVFDAYGTLFDFNSAAQAASDELGNDWLADTPISGRSPATRSTMR